MEGNASKITLTIRKREDFLTDLKPTNFSQQAMVGGLKQMNSPTVSAQTHCSAPHHGPRRVLKPFTQLLKDRARARREGNHSESLHG